MEQIKKQQFEKKEKIALVNRVNLINYGSVLQVYALCEAIKIVGYDVDVLWEKGTLFAHFDMRPQKALAIVGKLISHPSLISGFVKDVHTVKGYEYPERMLEEFASFRKTHFSLCELSHSELGKIGKTDEYKYYVCGSDQVWSSTTLYPDPLMYLRFAPKRKRVSYAPSLGRDYIPKYNRRILKKYINGIRALSVREQTGAKLIQKLTGREAQLILDPTLLHGKDFWLSKAKPAKIPQSEAIIERQRNNAPDQELSDGHNNGYVLCYFLNKPAEIVIKQIDIYAGSRTVVSLKHTLPSMEKTRDVFYPDCGPEEFISYIAGADHIFTDSYHGMLFSINFGKQFTSIERTEQEFDQSSRQKSILSQLGLSERYISGVFSKEEIDRKIDYAAVDEMLTAIRDKSYSYLRKALK